MLKRYIGDRSFYRQLLAIALPLMAQNAITNFVSMLDNIMVGQTGTLSMSGVSIANQLMFVFNLCIFGASSGAGIFTAQFHGSGNQEGIRHSFRFKILICTLLTAAGCGIFLLWGDELLLTYLQGEGNPSDAAEILDHAKNYLTWMLLGLLPFAISTAYSSTIRETGEAVVPMIAAITAVLVNLALNYLLIFGKLGLPALGVQGAAIATVISRVVELAIVAGWVHLNPAKNPFIRGAFRSLAIPVKLLKNILLKSLPLLANEFLWASGMAMMNQCYSTCSLDVVPALTISSTLYNLGSVAFLSMGNCVGIIMGQLLGRGAQEPEVRDTNRKLIAVSISSGIVFGALIIAFSGAFPLLYKTTDDVRLLAARLICISAVMMPFNAYTNACYFTLRSGGQTFVTFLFDSFFVWVFCVPLAYCLSRFTDLPILPLYAICQSADFIKCAIGNRMIHRGKWIQNLAKS